MRQVGLKSFAVATTIAGAALMVAATAAQAGPILDL